MYQWRKSNSHTTWVHAKMCPLQLFNTGCWWQKCRAKKAFWDKAGRWTRRERVCVWKLVFWCMSMLFCCRPWAVMLFGERRCTLSECMWSGASHREVIVQLQVLMNQNTHSGLRHGQFETRWISYHHHHNILGSSESSFDSNLIYMVNKIYILLHRWQKARIIFTLWFFFHAICDVDRPYDLL